MAGRQRRELFTASAEEGTGADQDCPHTLLRKSCEGRFEIAIHAGIYNNELQAQCARRRLENRDQGLYTRNCGVHDGAEQGSVWHQLAEQLQSLRRQLAN